VSFELWFDKTRLNFASIPAFQLFITVHPDFDSQHVGTNAQFDSLTGLLQGLD
jgi:hypothetical protein